jgi:hypothetical protein
MKYASMVTKALMAINNRNLRSAFRKMATLLLTIV